MYRVRIFSRHSSHDVLRHNLEKLNIRSVVRFGSLTPYPKAQVEINSIDSIVISSDKKLMKEKFIEAEVKTAPYVIGNTIEEIITKLNDNGIPYPIVAKSRNGSRGIGNTLVDDEHNLRNWANDNRDLSRYIFEKFFNYGLEFRLHITKTGCFYTCRKALKKETEENERWHRHVDNSVWFVESNPNFNKPNSWDDIVNDCVKALNAIGADVLSFDIRVQSNKTIKGKDREYQDYILIESNSASSFGNPNGDGLSICAQKYIEIIPQLIMEKI